MGNAVTYTYLRCEDRRNFSRKTSGSLMKDGIPRNSHDPVEKNIKEKTPVSSPKALTRFSSITVEWM